MRQIQCAAILTLVVGLCQAAYSGNYYLKSAATDWSNPESFTLDSADGADATVCPGASDIVYLPANKSCSFPVERTRSMSSPTSTPSCPM